MNEIFRRFRQVIRKLKMDKFKHTKAISLFTVGFLIFLIAFLFINDFFSVFTVSINGIEMGQVQNKNKVYSIIDSVEKDLSEKYGTEVTIKEGIITFSEAKVREMTPLDEESIINALSETKNSYLKAWAVTVNGRKVIALCNQQKAEQLLEDVKSHYLKKGSQYLNVDFKEKVEIREINISSDELLNYDEALRYVLTGTTEVNKYEVKSGESLWSIAEKYQINIEDLEAANPDIDPEKLQIGQEISLAISKPYLSVVTTEKAVVNEKIQYKITYKKTDALFEGEEKIKLKGVYGVKETDTEVVRENGKEISTKIIDSAIVKEPEDQIVLIGTKAIPSSLGTGALDNPTRGMLTSTFGRRWGKLHAGIDISNKKGTAILSADGGVVTFAGWKGNYGLLIEISHGNNRSTLYGHCSKILVKVGEVVTKGQQIATMGDTGNSTGVHLHFEVRVNNVPQDPLKYVDYVVN